MSNNRKKILTVTGDPPIVPSSGPESKTALVQSRTKSISKSYSKVTAVSQKSNVNGPPISLPTTTSLQSTPEHDH